MSAWAPSPPLPPSRSRASAGCQPMRQGQRRRHHHQRPGRRLDRGAHPWTMMYLQNLFNFEWEQTRSPAAPSSGYRRMARPPTRSPTPTSRASRHAPVMFTTDLSLKEDPKYREISKRFLENPEEFELAFAKAWFKLTHRDMGPRARYVGDEVPEEVLLWQDPIPAVDHELINARDIAELKSEILASGLTVPELVRTAWASAASYRGSDMRGGANGARIRLAPQKDWPVNDPASWPRSSRPWRAFSRTSTTRIRWQEGLAGRPDRPRRCRGHREGGQGCRLRRGGSLHAGRTTPPKSRPMWSPSPCSSRRPTASATTTATGRLSPAEMLVDRADLLTLTVPEMTVLVGGHARPRRQHRRREARGLHRSPRHPEQRLLRQPARHVHPVVEVGGAPKASMRDETGRRAS
jgi:catalase-peroxidase